MLKILLTKVFEVDKGLQEVEDEMNRLLSKVEGEILAVQVEPMDKDKWYRLYVTVK